MFLPLLIFLGLGAVAAGALFERGHAQDPHGQGVWETLKLHWQVLWHHQQAGAASDPATSAAHLAAARDAATQMAPQVQQVAATATNDFERARAVALSDLMMANAHLTAAMAELVHAKETFTGIPTATNRMLVDTAQREVDAAIANVHDKTAMLTHLGVRVPGVAHA